jgi:hypothetical protein
MGVKMSLFTDVDIVGNILYYLHINDISILLQTSGSVGTTIIKHYQIHSIDLNCMPMFALCYDIKQYLQHYYSYISGINFPEEPLWLFRTPEDGKYILKNDKYVKLDNIRFERKRFLTYYTTYEYLPFTNGFEHWKQLDEQQKYIIWCAITGTHPEIRLNKSLSSAHLATLISEIYWHYPQSFSRYYLDIYMIDTCDLFNAKCIAKNEIEAELKALTGARTMNLINEVEQNHCEELSEEFNNIKDHPQFGFILGALKINDFKDMAKAFYQEKIFSIQSAQFILDESETLRNIMKEIDEFKITQIHNLKTSNLNYIFHIEANYNLKECNEVINNMETSCAQQ